MPIIIPSELEIDAIHPQCLDNQFTSEEVMRYMLENGRLYNDREVKKRREDDTHMEFLRSLLYSSQVVINRAYFHNCDYLKNLGERQESALASLVQKRAIIPFLGKETTLENAGQYTVSDSDPDFVNRLLGLLDDEPTYVRFAREKEENDTQVGAITANFSGFCETMSSFGAGVLSDEGDRKPVEALTGALLNNSSHLNPADSLLVPKETVDRFGEYLVKLGHFAHQKSFELAMKGKSFGRQHVYAEFFTHDGWGAEDNIAAGKFKQEMRHDVPLQLLKKLVDLKYNANLPDMLERYTLTPASLPGRSVLPYAKKSSGSSSQESLRKLVEFKRAVMDNPPAVYLPQIRQMKLSDVETVRGFPEWREFRRSQEMMLKAGHTSLLDNFERYQSRLMKFQQKLGDWASEHSRVGGVFSTGVSLIFQIGSAVLLAEIMPHDTAITGHIAIETSHALLERAIPESVESFCVKLLVKAQQKATGLDKEHSYQLELMRVAGRIQRKEVEDMIKEIQNSDDLLQLKAVGPAEQANS